MTDSPKSLDISTKLERIAKLAREIRGTSVKTLAHHIDKDWLHEAYRRTRKDGAMGIDQQNASEYAQSLEANLQALHDRAKSGRYVAPPVRRVHIAKGDGTETRPIGIPTFEDKVLQRAVAMVIGEVYEQSFHDFSYGFRPGRSAHQALEVIQNASVRMKGGWVVEVDIRKFFDTVDHGHLQELLRRRIGDRVLLRLIGKWLNAGVMEGLVLSYPDEGTPQGGVISPLLANIYLHEVFDDWFVRDVQPTFRGRATPVRYADDIVVIFERSDEAERFLAMLPERFGTFGLTLHPEKTRLLSFRPPTLGNEDGAGTFNFLGFTHYWSPSRRGYWIVKQRTAKDRFSRALRRISEWCRWHRHDPLDEQHRSISKKLVGHYAYYGITSNFLAISKFQHEVKRTWRKALSRRSQQTLPWRRMNQLVQRFPLPQPRIIHRYGA
jgi:group II intron reverse transcriptase/maturase